MSQVSFVLRVFSNRVRIEFEWYPGITLGRHLMGRDMSKFIFKLLQRVTVPTDMAGAAGVQGIVTEGTATLGKETIYQLQWPNVDKPVGLGGLLEMVCGIATEGELDAAQYTKMLSKEDTDAIASNAFREGHAAGWESHKAVVAGRRTKPARKRTRK